MMILLRNWLYFVKTTKGWPAIHFSQPASNVTFLRRIVGIRRRYIASEMNGGESGIRTHGPPLRGQRFSRPPQSTTLPSLQNHDNVINCTSIFVQDIHKIYWYLMQKSNRFYNKNVKLTLFAPLLTLVLFFSRV
jgi:hypothetical protein